MQADMFYFSVKDVDTQSQVSISHTQRSPDRVMSIIHCSFHWLSKMVLFYSLGFHVHLHVPPPSNE